MLGSRFHIVRYILLSLSRKVENLKNTRPHVTSLTRRRAPQDRERARWPRLGLDHAGYLQPPVARHAGGRCQPHRLASTYEPGT